MVDARFHGGSVAFKLSDIIALTGAKLSAKLSAELGAELNAKLSAGKNKSENNQSENNQSGGDRIFTNVAPLDTAGGNDVSFLDNVAYISAFSKSAAGACFVKQAYADRAPSGMILLITEQPYYCYALLAANMYNNKPPPSGIDKTAIIGKDVKIGENVYIGAYSVIGDNVEIGAKTIIASNCSISHSIIGANCLIHSGVRIGQDGFGFAPSANGLIKVPQLGRVIINNDVEIGANSCIDRGSGPDTIIGAGTKIDNLVQIGHNVRIGKHCVIVSQVGISGSTIIEDGVMIGGQAGISGHITIGSGAKIAAKSGIISDVEKGATFGGYPAINVRNWHRQTVALAKLAKSQRNIKSKKP